MFGIAIYARTTVDCMSDIADIASFDMNLVVFDISRDIRTTTIYFFSYSATLDIDLVARDVAFSRKCTINVIPKTAVDVERETAQRSCCVIVTCRYVMCISVRKKRNCFISLRHKCICNICINVTKPTKL